MIYLVETRFAAPKNLDSASLARLREAESRAAASLQERGILTQLWRDLETGAAWGVWEIPAGENLQSYQQELPCFPYMTVSIHPIMPHPNSHHRSEVQETD